MDAVEGIEEVVAVFGHVVPVDGRRELVHVEGLFLLADGL